MKYKITSTFERKPGIPSCVIPSVFEVESDADTIGEILSGLEPGQMIHRPPYANGDLCTTIVVEPAEFTVQDFVDKDVVVRLPGGSTVQGMLIHLPAINDAGEKTPLSLQGTEYFRVSDFKTAIYPNNVIVRFTEDRVEHIDVREGCMPLITLKS